MPRTCAEADSADDSLDVVQATRFLTDEYSIWWVENWRALSMPRADLSVPVAETDRVHCGCRCLVSQ